MKANWSIFKTKEELSEVCQKNDIEVIFFEGRGGPPARGGGKSHRFYAAQGDRIANNEIQLTVQGQTITSRYGTKEQFTHNCNQLLTAGLSREIQNEKMCLDDASRIYELRIYESHNYKAAQKKIEMFNEGGEIEIFKKTGLNPVFFGETLVGPLMPNLTYMLVFDDMADRDKNWKVFADSPEWKELSSDPQYKDTVSNISDIILSPASCSQI